MTRRSDLMCEDIFGCDHKPETPVIDDHGVIVFWICRCGQKHPVKAETEAPAPKPEGE